MKLTGAVQESLLSLLCYDTKSVEVSALVDAKFFDPYFAEVAEEVQKYIGEYKKPPVEHTIHIIETLSARFPEKAEFYKRIFESSKVTYKTINVEYVLSQAQSFTKYQHIKRSLSTAIKALQREDEHGLIAAEAAIQKALESPQIASDLGLELSDTDRVVSFLTSEEVLAFPTGIKALDEKGLGPARKRLNLFIGLSGAGKSWWLCHLAKQAFIHRKKVLYVTLELSEADVSQRMVQSLFSIAKRSDPIKICRFETDGYGKFESLIAGEEIKRIAMSDPATADIIATKLNSIKSRTPIIIKEFPTNSLSVKDLDNYLDLLEARKKFIPDLLILDYADLMNLDAKNLRVDVGVLYKKLRGLAVKRNIAIATATQANRAAVKAKWIMGDNASEDFSKIATSDTVITYNQTPSEHALGLARLFVAKGRTDRDKFAILINQAYGIGQFALDSVEYTNNYFDELKDFVVDSVGEE